METFVFQIKVPKWNVEEETGYKPKTTFWEDFSIAEAWGEKGIRSTFERAFKEWRKNYIFLTELVMVLNHKICQHYEPNKPCPIARLYDELWRRADDWACNNLKGHELEYFYDTTD